MAGAERAFAAAAAAAAAAAVASSPATAPDSNGGGGGSGADGDICAFAQHNLALLWRREGDPCDMEVLLRAERALRLAIAAKPRYTEAYYALGNLLDHRAGLAAPRRQQQQQQQLHRQRQQQKWRWQQQQDIEGAEAAYRACIDCCCCCGDDAPVRSRGGDNGGGALSGAGCWSSAAAAHAGALNNLAILLAKHRRDYAGAESLFRVALSLHQCADRAEVSVNLARVRQLRLREQQQ